MVAWRVESEDRVQYRPPTDPVLVDVPAFEFVMVEGSGDPNTSVDYQAAVAALYAFSYPVVITLKKAGRSDLKVRPLEGLWWAEDIGVFDSTREDRSAWRWTMMIRQPDDIPVGVTDAGMVNVTKKVGSSMAERVRFERFDEGRCAQLMHHGPYQEEGPSIARLHDFVAAQGLRLRGNHHEIYLSDPRKAAPAKMRTVLRHPVTAE